MKRQTILYFICLLALFLAANACGPDPEPSDGSGGPGDSGSPPQASLTDLALSRLTIDGRSDNGDLTPGGAIDIELDIRNSDAALSTPAGTVTLYQSTDDTIDTATDTGIGNFPFKKIEAGGVFEIRGKQTTVPEGTDAGTDEDGKTYHYAACIPKTTICSNTLSKTVIPDPFVLEAYDLRVAPNRVTQVADLKLSYCIRNIGGSIYPEYDPPLQGVSYSTSTTIPTEEKDLANTGSTGFAGRLQAGQETCLRETDLTIHATAISALTNTTGTYYAYTCLSLEDRPTEHICSNFAQFDIVASANLGTASLTLVADSIVITPPSLVAGSDISVTINGQNTGIAPSAGTETVSLYQSSDAGIDTSTDTSIGTLTIPVINGSETWPISGTITIPADTAANQYHYGVCLTGTTTCSDTVELTVTAAP